jgi:shikimate 5-dehydrogenase
VTRDDETPLVREAKLAGIPAIGGLEMLLEQAMKQFEIWTGQTVAIDVMRGAAVSSQNDS